jgi:minor extracellular serine protease Vpr
MRGHRIFTLAATAALVITLAPGSMPNALAGRDPTARFTPIALGDDFTPVMLPNAADPTRRVTVFVEMQGDSVADARGNSADNRISDSDKDSIKRNLKSRQDALRPEIERRGGTVQTEYQSAVNGLRIEIERGRIEEIAALPGVTAVRSFMTYKLDNATSVPFIGAPTAWNGPAGFRGEGVKVGIIDTGIDYTHANFGGPGTVAAFNTANANTTDAPDPALIGRRAPKVKGGVDLVGDAYDASAPAGSPLLIPHPDPDPLDCNGHGSHVGGTAAGFGVTTAGATYAGPYNSSINFGGFRIGPGVAPKADLYAIRVFGCDGSTNVVVDAIEWAVDHDLDVINMSLGSPFGGADTADAVAVNKAVRAGVIVVASSGNEGPSPYMTGSPASAEGAISVAAVDSTATFPGATLTLSTGPTIPVINANGATFSTTTFKVKVLRTAAGGVSLGCDPAEYAGSTGMLVVTLRGTCARVARAVYGQKAGAAAVAMINTDANFPPFEGQITSNPDTGELYTVTIPFLGVRGVLGPNPTPDGDNLVAADGGSATLANSADLANPGFRIIAGFSSAGPRTGDSALKPDISAPGVSINSTAVGSGNQGTRLSGTSMSAPHVAGVAALARQAHPTWRASDIKAAIVNTGNPGLVAGYTTRAAGTGLTQPVGATRTQTIATSDRRGTSLSFGYKELGGTFIDSETINLTNRGSSTARFFVSITNVSGSAHTTRLSRTLVTVPGRGDASIDLRLTVPATQLLDSTAFRDVAGLVTFTPASGDNGGVTLRVPYYLVPRAVSELSTTLDGALNSTTSTSATARIRNRGVIAGNADFYAWGLADKRDPRQGTADLRGVGVQSFPFASAADPNRRLLVFAVNTWERWSNAASNEFDIPIDVNGDGVDDFVVIGFDFGAATTGVFDGRLASFILNLTTGGLAVDFLADAPMNGSTLYLPVLTSRLGGLSMTANPRFSYQAAIFDLTSPAQDETTGIAKFNAWTSSISQGDFVNVAPGATETSPVSINSAEWALTPALGLFVATSDDRSGQRQVTLIGVPTKGHDGRDGRFDERDGRGDQRDEEGD